MQQSTIKYNKYLVIISAHRVTVCIVVTTMFIGIVIKMNLNASYCEKS